MTEETEAQEVETEAQEVETEAQEVETQEVETEAQEVETEAPDYQKIIAEKAYEARQARREKEELAQRLKALEDAAPKSVRPETPPIPDPWADDFEEKIKVREQALIKQAEFDALQRARNESEQEQQRQAQEAQQRQVYERATTYTKRAAALGISTQDLQQAGAVLQGAVSEDVAGFILDSDRGPLLTKYLANNPLELDKLSGMAPMQAAVYLETNVRQKAEKLSAKGVTKAPAPADHISGGGAAPTRGPKGARFE